jgi:hypothetical protein
VTYKKFLSGLAFPGNLIITADLIDALDNLEQVALAIAFKIAENTNTDKSSDLISSEFLSFIHKIIDINDSIYNNKFLEDINYVYKDIKSTKNPILVSILPLTLDDLPKSIL